MGTGRGGDGAYSFAACVSILTNTHTSLSKRTTGGGGGVSNWVMGGTLILQRQEGRGEDWRGGRDRDDMLHEA